MSFDNINMGDLGRDLNPQQKPGGWWRRNWKWFVPTLFLGMLIMCSGCVAAIIFMFIGGLRHTEPYVVAMEKIQANQEAQEGFGQPIRDNSWIPSISPDRDNIDIRWDLIGPKGKGKAYVKSRLTGNKWEIVVIEVILPDGKKLILHDEGPGGNEAPPFEPQGESKPEKSQETATPDLNPNIPMPEETEPKK